MYIPKSYKMNNVKAPDRLQNIICISVADALTVKNVVRFKIEKENKV